MAGCPINRDHTAEVCFIGRSNVGKSSLINMIFNRKALAYTSKRPGKTQQFNFFTVNDIPDKEKEIKYGDDIAGQTGKTKDDDSFYIVDLPGFGYAKVPEEQKQKWMTFMYEYLMTRPNLRIVFHLIDSRHGPMNDDRIIMQQIATTLQHRSSSDNLHYVVVLTKADKNVKGNIGKSSGDNKSNTNKPQQRTITNSGGKVSKAVQIDVVRTMEECGINVHRTPIILTSAETKLGRDDIWRYLQIATERKKKQFDLNFFGNFTKILRG
jgi:GTP-binding protein EngB required for normal cell division